MELIHIVFNCMIGGVAFVLGTEKKWKGWGILAAIFVITNGLYFLWGLNKL
jgi:hypothetical protein